MRDVQDTEVSLVDNDLATCKEFRSFVFTPDDSLAEQSIGLAFSFEIQGSAHVDLLSFHANDTRG